jgi:predicted small metal-binding protein
MRVYVAILKRGRFEPTFPLDILTLWPPFLIATLWCLVPLINELSYLDCHYKQVHNLKHFQWEEYIMGRYCIDCRDYPGDVKCSVALSADSKDELLEVVVQHGEKVHGYKDTPEFRESIVKEFKKGTPCA